MCTTVKIAFLLKMLPLCCLGLKGMTHFPYKINGLSVVSQSSGISLTKVYPHESDLYCNLSFFFCLFIVQRHLYSLLVKMTNTKELRVPPSSSPHLIPKPQR